MNISLEENRVLSAVCGLILILFAAATFIFYQYQKNQLLMRDPKVVEKIQTERYIKEINKLVLLPKEEKPVIKMITDADKVKSNPFFKKAKNGDLLFVYEKNQKAILYDPISKKVLELEPLKASDSASPSANRSK